MANFTTLLIHTCDIQSKSLNTQGYEQVESWSNLITSVPCRHQYDKGVKIRDTEIRDNIDDDIFFFNADQVDNVLRGRRIVENGVTYDIIKVKKCSDSIGLHHLEATAREVDHN